LKKKIGAQACPKKKTRKKRWCWGDGQKTKQNVNAGVPKGDSASKVPSRDAGLQNRVVCKIKEEKKPAAEKIASGEKRGPKNFKGHSERKVPQAYTLKGGKEKGCRTK